MSIPVGEDIGLETHHDVDQILYFVKGMCEASINGEVRNVEKHDIVFVPAGAQHNFKNIGDEDLKLFTVYSPPEHPDGTIHATKADAQKGEVNS
jgi:mannose-6-phosphate isomerase-like protein (cupin superfamily)